MKKPKVEMTGQITVEKDGGAILVGFPDGGVKAFVRRANATRAIKRYFERHTPKNAIGVGQVVSYDGTNLMEEV